MLQIQDLSVKRANVQILQGVTISVDKGSIVALLGRNAAGKTTLLSTICGLVDHQRGSVRFDGEEISRMAPHEIARRGISFCQTEKQLFKDMNVCENLEMGAFIHRQQGRQALGQSLHQIYTHFPHLEALKKHRAGNLSGGEQKLLAVGCALMSKPRCLLLDEPLLGLSTRAAVSLATVIANLQSNGMTIIFTEQSPRLANVLPAYSYLLERGEVIETAVSN